MSPAVIALIIAALQSLIEEEPEIAAQIQSLLTKQNPTPADWQALHAQVLGKSYADYVPASALPPGSAPAPVSAPASPAEAQTPPINDSGTSAEQESQAQDQKAADSAPAPAVSAVPVGVKP